MEIIDPSKEIVPTSNKEYGVGYFFHICSSCLFTPTNFFKNQFKYIPSHQIFLFGLISAWITSIISFFWATVHGVFAQKLMLLFWGTVVGAEEMAVGAANSQFLKSASLVLLAPVLFFVQTWLTAAFIKVVAYPFFENKSEPPTVKGLAEIFAISLNGTWLLALPFLGGVFSYLACMYISMVGLKQRYHLSTGRALGILLIPYLFFFALIVVFLVLLSVLAVNMSPEDLLKIVEA